MVFFWESISSSEDDDEDDVDDEEQALFLGMFWKFEKLKKLKNAQQNSTNQPSPSFEILSEINL